MWVSGIPTGGAIVARFNPGQQWPGKVVAVIPCVQLNARGELPEIVNADDSERLCLGCIESREQKGC